MIYCVITTLKEGILDAEGELTLKNLKNRGFDEVTAARSGQVIWIEVPDGTPESVIHEMCQRFLAQRGTTSWQISVEPTDSKLVIPTLPPSQKPASKKKRNKTTKTRPAK